MTLRNDAPRIMEEVSKGLDRVSILKPGHGFLSATVGASRLGAFATVEAGWKPTSAVDLFAFGRVSGVEAIAGAGVRVAF